MKLYSISNVAKVLIEACGEKTALAVVEQFGGQRIDVPKAVGGKLLEALGADVTAVLVGHYAGCRIDAAMSNVSTERSSCRTTSCILE